LFTVAQTHPRSGDAKPVSDALQDPHVEHLAALEDLAHLRLGLTGQPRDLALTYAKAPEQPVERADVTGGQRAAHLVLVEERGVNLLHR
jgi:hypothetical protein